MDTCETEKFTLNNTPCAINIRDDDLVITFRKNEEEIVVHDEKLRRIPFSEILTIKFVNPQDQQSKNKVKLNLKKALKLPRIAIKTIERCANHKWKLTTVKFKSVSEEFCKKWAQVLNDKLSADHASLRPKSLLIFVNPHGGNGDGQNIYEKRVKPIFEEADIETNVITTSFRHHAKAHVETEDLSVYDGIVAVGGDGMVNEVINGLICRTQKQNQISLHAKKGYSRECEKFIRPDMKVGVIPAGSTDCVSYVTQGINDAETSALHIALGDSHPVDVVSLHNADGIFEQFSMSLNGYGYFGDMLRHSENYRWMGPPRYSLAGVNTFLKNKSYSGEIHYLPADCKEGPKSLSFCRAPCEICQDGLADSASTPLFTPVASDLSLNNFDMPLVDEYATEVAEESGASEVQTTDHEIYEKENDKTESDEGIVMKSKDLQDDDHWCNDDGCLQNKEDLFMTDGIYDADASITQNRPISLDLTRFDTKEHWQVIRGDFMAINGVSMSCACERSPLGLSPYSHLSDGALDLIVVQSCSRFEFLKFLISHTGKGNRFDFPFVEVYRVKAFQFIPASLTPMPSDLNPSPRSGISSPDSPLDASGAETVHISLEDFTVKYSRSGKKKRRRRMKRSQSAVESNPVSTWNADGEIVRDANMTVRVHRGLILMFCRGIENL